MHLCSYLNLLSENWVWYPAVHWSAKVRAAPVVPPRPKWISLHCVQTIWRNTIYLVDKYILLFRQRSFPIYISWLFFFCNLVRAAPVVPPRPKWISLHCVQTIWKHTIHYVDKCTLLFWQIQFSKIHSALFFFKFAVSGACCPISTQLNFSPLCANYFLCQIEFSLIFERLNLAQVNFSPLGANYKEKSNLQYGHIPSNLYLNDWTPPKWMCQFCHLPQVNFSLCKLFALCAYHLLCQIDKLNFLSYLNAWTPPNWMCCPPQVSF